MVHADAFWLKASLEISSNLLSKAEALLLEHGALSITIEDAKDQPLFEPLPGETPLWEHSVLSALYSSQHEPKQLHKELEKCLHTLSIKNIQIVKIENRQWERVWMDDFKPLRFGERLWIHPTHCPPPEKDAVNLALDPGLAFGTGSHPTTALCLEWLDKHSLENKSVLDYGCGSGILAIAAAKLGASPVYATDIDEQAITASTANAQLNGVEHVIELSTVSEFTNKAVDVVIANILSNILIELSETLAKNCLPNAQLVLSGLLHNQIDDVIAAYTPWFQFLEPRMLEDWVLLEAIRKA